MCLDWKGDSWGNTLKKIQGRHDHDVYHHTSFESAELALCVNYAGAACFNGSFNWRTAAATIMRQLSVERACVFISGRFFFFFSVLKTKTVCLFTVLRHKQISSMTVKISSPKLHNAPLIQPIVSQAQSQGEFWNKNISFFAVSHLFIYL